MDINILVLFLLSTAILFVGVIGFIRVLEWWQLWIGVAFALFAVAYMLEFLGLNEGLETAVLIIRIAGFAIVGVTLGWTGFRR
jgi:hypothetical protein